MLRVLVLAVAEVFVRPGQRHFQLNFIIDFLVDAAAQFGHINRLDLHPQPGFKEVMVDDGASDAHRNAPHGEIAFPFHTGNGKPGAGKTQQLFLNVGRDGGVVGILDIMAVDRERRDPFLTVGGQRGGQIDGAGALRAVKSPDGLRAQRIHVDGFAAVAPARGDGDRHADVLAAELLLTGGGFRHTGDAGVGNHALDLRAAGMTELLANQRGGGFCHIHGLRFQRLAYPHPTSVNHRANTNFW